MYNIFSNSGKVAYGVKSFTVDTEADITTLPTRSCTPGSTAFVIETSQYYKLTTTKEWKKVTLSTGGSGGGSGDNEYNGGEPSIDDPGYNSEYDGGEPK